MKIKLLIASILIAAIGCSESYESSSDALVESSENKNLVEDPPIHQQKDTIVQDLNQVVYCNGKVDVPPQFKLDVFSKSIGYLESIHVIDGQQVKKGDVLVSVSGKEIIEIQEAYLLARLEFERLSQIHQRNTELIESNAVSVKEFQQIKNEMDQAKVKENALINKLKFEGIPLPVSETEIQSTVEIRSKIDGYVSNLSANLGMRVSTDKCLMQIISDQHYHFELEVFPTDAEKLRLSQKVLIKPSGSNKEIEGYIYLIDKAVNTDRQTVTVHVHPVNTKEFMKQFAYVEAVILTNEFVAEDIFALD